MKRFVGITLGLGTIAALALVLSGNWFQASAADPFEGSTFTAKRDDLEITITENGYLKAKNSEQLKPGYGGQSTITWIIDEGSEVEEGDLLVEFDATELENDLDETKTRLIQSEAEFEAAQANLEIQKRDNEAEIEKAELALEVARLTLKRFEEGEVPNTRRKKKLDVKKAESELLQSEKSYEKVPSLLAEGYLTPIQAEQEEFKLEEARTNLTNAEKELELYEQYTLPMERRQKEADVRNKERDLATARERAQIKLKEREARVSQQERHVKSAKSSIAEIEKNLGHMKIHAPRPGIVIYGDPKRNWWSDEIQVGTKLWSGRTVITLPDLSEMQVMVDVHEADIDLVAEEQVCLITIDTYKDRTYHGTVTDVATVASSGQWGDSTNKQFSVEVTIRDLEDELRSGLTAKVEIAIETVEDQVLVPLHAVFKDGENYVVFLPQGSEFEQQPVTLGKSNAHYVAIAEGLTEGQRVLLFDPREEALDERRSSDAESEADSGPETMPAATLAG